MSIIGNDDVLSQRVAKQLVCPAGEIAIVVFDIDTAELIQKGSKEIAVHGGPDMPDSSKKAREWAVTIMNSLTAEVRNTIDYYTSGVLSAIVFEGMIAPKDQEAPLHLLDMEALSSEFVTIELASRSQILLALLEQNAFAFDIDNHGKVVRLVGNFNGGGLNKLPSETGQSEVPLSSHSGVALGAHTEAPYYETRHSLNGRHSPAPSSLILTARWNRLQEPTTLITVQNVLDEIGGHAAIGLTLPAFGFTRSDTFTSEDAEGVSKTSILKCYKDGIMEIRFNAYRSYVEKDAPVLAETAFDKLVAGIDSAAPVKINLQSSKALVINNYRCLHGRDVVKDNARLLVRLFGYTNNVEAVVLSNDPLVVQG